MLLLLLLLHKVDLHLAVGVGTIHVLVVHLLHVQLSVEECIVHLMIIKYTDIKRVTYGYITIHPAYRMVNLAVRQLIDLSQL